MSKVKFIFFTEKSAFKIRTALNQDSSNKIEPNLHKGCLYDRYLLVSVKEVISTERWDWNRENTNYSSRLIDFDLTVNTDEYKMIKKFTKICIFIKQHFG